MLTREEAYHRARLASEKIRDDAYRAADQLCKVTVLAPEGCAARSGSLLKISAPGSTQTPSHAARNSKLLALSRHRRIQSGSRSIA
jgi:hypothetical protein